MANEVFLMRRAQMQDEAADDICPKGDCISSESTSCDDESTCVSGQVDGRVIAGQEMLMEATPSKLVLLDRKLAWMVALVPPAAFVGAMILWLRGYPPRMSEALLTIGGYIVALTGVEVGFHRHFTHRSFKAKTWVRVILAICGSFAFEGPVIWWAATHRRHHKYSDREGDPHSPHLHSPGIFEAFKGAFHAHMGWLFVPQSTRAPGSSRYVLDLYRDHRILRIHMSYFYWLAIGIVLPGLINGLVHLSWGRFWMGILWGGLVRIFLLNHVFFWCINSVTHLFGSRPFNTDDQSRNNVWLAIPTLGEAWHNNHHAFPTAAYLGFHWWQIDPGGWVISALETLGLAWDVKRASPQLIAKKSNA